MTNFLRLWLKPTLILISFFLLTVPAFSQHGNSQGKTYTFRKGTHHASRLLKNRFLWHVEDLHWHTCFDTSARYILRNPDGSIDDDQYDWSKLSGITFTPLRPLSNTAMVGWRYNHLKDSIELIPYFHVGGTRFFRDNPHLTVGINEPFEHEIHLNYYKKIISVTIITPRGRLTEKKVYRTFKSWAVQIHPFFGGNKRAPRTIKLSVWLEQDKRRLKYYD